MFHRLLASIFLYFFGLSHLNAAVFNSSVSNEGKIVISLDGQISPGDTDQFRELVKNANIQSRLVSGIRLNSLGGNLAEGAALAAAIRFAKIATVVANGKVCASACFLAFAGGNEKYVSYSAQVGIHSASDLNGTETVSSGSATVEMARFAKELGVPDVILGKMVVTHANQITWLTPNELRAMGTTLTGKPSQVLVGEPNSNQSPQNSALPQNQSVSVNQAGTSWTQILDTAISTSTTQNNGNPRFSRVCQPELKSCVTGIFFKGQNKEETVLKTTENIDGTILKREICIFNTFMDIRTCRNWDTGSTSREMKSADGVWNLVGN